MTLRLTLFGPFQLCVAEDPPLHFRTNKIRALLAYLVAENGRSHTRHTLATLLWPEVTERRARQNLSQAIHRLCKTVDTSVSGLSKTHLQITRQTITVLPNSNIFCDVTAFSKRIAETHTHSHTKIRDCTTCLEKLRQAVDLYQGEFLAGFHLRDSAPFEEWLMLKREQYHSEALRALKILIQVEQAQENHTHVEQYARRLLAIEPWNEMGWQNLMLSLANQGYRSQALVQFEACQAQLWETLGVEVGGETVRIAEQIRDCAYESDGDTAQPVVSSFTPDEDFEPETAVSPTSPSHLHNLPRQMTPFFNRDDEQEKLVASLQNPQHRWVTIVGEGGVGKTRLAIEVASHLVDAFADGVWFVPLAGIQAEGEAAIQEKLVMAIANAVGFQFRGSERLQVQLIRYLSNRQALLILDNFEHLLEGGDIVKTLLERSHGLTFLCTSREPLQYQCENVLPLRGLMTPAMTPFPAAFLRDIDGWESYPSLQLFVSTAERVTFSQPELSASTLHTMSNICHWVGGNPLGIELAASWLRHMTLEEVWESLKASHHFLSTRMRDVPYRHRSIHRVFEQSWSLLNQQEQQALLRLSVFQSGFTAEAAKQVGQLSPLQLSQLVQYSLVKRTASGRYILHEVLRQFCAEQWSESERHSAQYDHMVYYLDFLARQEAVLQGTHPQEVAEQIDHDLDNIRLAWGVLLRCQEYHRLLQDIMPLSSYFQLRGYSREAKSFFQAALHSINRATNQVSVEIVALVIRELCRFQIMLAEYQTGIQMAETAVSLAQQCGDTVTEGAACIFHAEALWRQGSYQEAQDQLDKAKPIIANQMQAPLAGSFYFHQGVVFDLRGEPQEALQALRQAAQIWQLLGNRRAQATTLNSLGLVAYHQHQLTEAYHTIWQANQIQHELGNLLGQMVTAENLSLVAIHQRQFEEAETLLKDVQVLAAHTANPLSEARSFKGLGWIALERAQPQQACLLLEKSLDLFQEAGLINEQAEVWCLLGAAHLQHDAVAEAQRCLNVGLMLAQEVQNSYTECLAQLILAELYQHQAEPTLQALAACTALDLATQLQNTEFIQKAVLLKPQTEDKFFVESCAEKVFA
ncbi:MAG: BTAD domain-containing putative transcriptional regulator [Chloroflexota bacterium]